MNRAETLRRSLNEKNCVKVIAGINNFDADRVRKVVTAAHQGGANAVDIAAREDLIRSAREITEMPIFVSSVKPEELEMAARCGADVLEIGNYDALYAEGMRISADEVLEITRETMRRAGREVMYSVTVPGHIDINEQIALAQRLEEMGVDMIQTEGAAVADVRNNGARGLIEKAHVSIANTIELVRNVNMPVMTASGITVTTAPLAIAAGASAVGIGSAVNKLNSEIEMIASVRSIVESVSRVSMRSREEEMTIA